MSFFTRKKTIETHKSPVDKVTLDGKDGNSWEEIVAHLCEQHDEIVSYVKNDGLAFSIPYLHGGVSSAYHPDFLVRLAPHNNYSDNPAGDVVDRYLIVEVSGGRKSKPKREAKADTAERVWCRAVNAHGGFGRWGYVDIDSMESARSTLSAAIAKLQTDNPPPEF